jgi:hypothetical protein
LVISGLSLCSPSVLSPILRIRLATDAVTSAARSAGPVNMLHNRWSASSARSASIRAPSTPRSTYVTGQGAVSSSMKMRHCLRSRTASRYSSSVIDLS